MEVGIFVPINNNGWLISETSPQYMPSFDLNKDIARRAEKYGVDFLLSMIKLRGFGGKTEFWEYGLESFTLMAGLAAVTEKIKIYATCPTLVIPPAFAARMCNTIDSISHGRFGLNLITGWQRPEYSQMGLWPGDEHFRNRYQMVGEYAHILRELWETGVSDFKGTYYQMEDCRVRPVPEGEMKIICAGSSDEGLAFLRPICRLRLLPRQGSQHAHGLRPEQRAADGGDGEDRPRRQIYALFMVIAGGDGRGGDGEVDLLPRGGGRGGGRLARLPGRGGQDQRHHQRPPARRQGERGEPQHGHPGGLLRERRPDARRGGDGAQYGRRPAGLRRLHRRDGGVRDPDPAADEVPGQLKISVTKGRSG
jgi:alkanesulfonate monooxygenase SsuD/methylene tetrahydromethanopterin reductase-like flavin-dependent oxidoreductase (luciferase family)